MFVFFFHELKAAGLPVTLREYLTLIEAMEQELADRRVESFYYLSRAALVKDERNLDMFDRVFGHVFKGLKTSSRRSPRNPDRVAEEAYRKTPHGRGKETHRSDGRPDKLLETLSQRLAEQKGRHEGGKKWIGTGGTSLFGAYGYNPEGVRIGQDETAIFAP